MLGISQTWKRTHVTKSKQTINKKQDDSYEMKLLPNFYILLFLKVRGIPHSVEIKIINVSCC